MPQSSEIVQRLSADNSNYRSVMNQSEDIADRVGKGIFKKLDLRGAMTAIAVAIGLNIESIAESFARRITGLSKSTEESFKQLAQLSDEVTRRTQEVGRSKLTTEQQYQLALQDQARLQSKISDNLGVTAEEQVQLQKDKLALLDAEQNAAKLLDQYYDEIHQKEQAAANGRKKIDEDLARAREEQSKYQAKLLEDEGEEAVKWYKRRMDLERQLRDQKLKTITDSEKIKLFEKENLEYKKDQKKYDKDSNDYKALQVKINENNLDIEEARKNVAEAAAKAEKTITQEKQLQVTIGSKGRGDTDLSDRELERKIANIKKDLGARNAGQLGRYQGAAGEGGYDILGESLKGSLAQAQAELDFRNRVRNSAGAFGADAAFGMFPGLSEQRLRDILSGGNASTDDILSDIRDLLKNKGIKVRQLGGI